MEKTKGYGEAAKALPAIIGTGSDPNENPEEAFANRNILINLTWVLTYLDGLESNLLAIKNITFNTN